MGESGARSEQTSRPVSWLRRLGQRLGLVGVKAAVERVPMTMEQVLNSYPRPAEPGNRGEQLGAFLDWVDERRGATYAGSIDELPPLYAHHLYGTNGAASWGMQFGRELAERIGARAEMEPLGYLMAANLLLFDCGRGQSGTPARELPQGLNLAAMDDNERFLNKLVAQTLITDYARHAFDPAFGDAVVGAAQELRQ